jgi:type IV secretory pathway ATPase VirB11/archaellum biosynthesis ATPase
MLLFLITLSYLNKNPLHALVQGSSGSGKTHLISRIADLIGSHKKVGEKF